MIFGRIWARGWNAAVSISGLYLVIQAMRGCMRLDVNGSLNGLAKTKSIFNSPQDGYNGYKANNVSRQYSISSFLYS